MCYEIYLSTTSPRDLGTAGDGVICLERWEEADPDQAVSLLQYPHRWYLSIRPGECSCPFRHWQEIDGELYPAMESESPDEFAEELAATARAFDLFADIVSAGERLDLVDIWKDTALEEMRSKALSIQAVSRENFRFLENFRLEFTP